MSTRIYSTFKDNMGLNETNGGKSCSVLETCPRIYIPPAMTDSSKSPRGIRGFKLDDGTFSEWKVQGKVGGYTKSVIIPLTPPAEIQLINRINPAIPTKFAEC